MKQKTIAWRFVLEDTQTGKRKGLANLSELTTALSQVLGELTADDDQPA